MDFYRGISLVQTKTFWSALLALIAVVAQQFNVVALAAWAVNPDTANNILTAVGLIGTFGTMVFRYTATSTVTSVLPSNKT